MGLFPLAREEKNKFVIENEKNIYLGVRQLIGKAFKIVKNVIKGIIIAYLAIVAFIGVYNIIQRYAFGNSMPKLFGFASAVVVSGSMEPEISTGDLVIVKSCGEYAAGEVILFYSADGGVYVTHRIVSVTGTGEDARYTTQGDANNAEDLYTPSYGDVVGKVVFVVGGAGSAIEFLQTPAGMLVLISCGAAVWLLADVAGMLIMRRFEKKEEKNEENDG